jgi:SAM-dependent methyltransferase
MERCPFCHEPADFHAAATDIEYFTTPERFEFWHCKACDILFISPMLTEQLNVIYPPNYYAFDNVGTKSFPLRVKEWIDQRMLRRILLRIGGEALHVLDVGGGTGWLAGIARSADSRVVDTCVVDLDANAKTRAEANGHRFFQGRIEDFESPEKFELILMLNLVEHLPRPDLMLAHVARMLSPNGRIVIKTPNFRSLDAILYRYRSWGGYHCPRHFVLFSRESLARTLHGAGLAVEQFSYTQGAPFWCVSIMNQMRLAGLISIDAKQSYAGHPILPFLQIVTAAFDFVRRPFSRLSQMVIVARRED